MFSTLVDSPADNVIQMQPRKRFAADSNAAVVAPVNGTLADVELDRWANRLARLLLGRGVNAGTRVAIAISPQVEVIVAESAVLKIGATPALLAADEATAPGATFGITTKAHRPHLTDAIDWLVLDDRSTLQRYLVSSDAPISDADRRPTLRSA
jgi:non-ribosomal peptide synthetase component F